MLFLIKKIFIKSNNTKDASVRVKYGVVASIFSLIINIFLFIIKLIVGLISNSISIIGDSINNLTDMGSSIISFFGFKLSSKPADEDHPYGHQRIEYITSFIISMVVIVVSVQLMITSINKVVTKEVAEYNYITLIVLVVSVIIKFYLSIFNSKIAKEINSTTLKASSKDSLNDCISTIVILISAILSIIYDINIDGYMGILVAIFILYSGISLAKETISPLIGEKTDAELIKKIINEIKTYEEILGIHDLLCHSYGPTKIFMSLHAEVNSNSDIVKIHEVIDNIELIIKTKYNVILVIHMDPISVDCSITNKYKEIVDKFLKEKYSELSFHDFRIVNGESHINILFDIVKPIKSKINNNVVKEELISLLSTNEVKINLIISFEENFSTLN